MKPTREKRTTTEPGLGKVTTGARRVTLGEGVDTSSIDDIEQVPISAPAPSGGGQTVRTTRSLEKPATSEGAAVEIIASAPPSAPASAPPMRAPAPSYVDPRADEDDSPSGRVERIDRVESTRPRTPHEATNAPSKPPQKNMQPRRSVAGFSAVEAGTGKRPVGVPAGSVPVAVAPAGPARSKRVSIREDNLGNRVMNVPDAVGVAGRAVPKLLKSKAEIAAAPIDHRAGFLLAHVDGVTTVAGLVDICGMTEEEVEQILERLRRLGIVAVR